MAKRKSRKIDPKKTWGSYVFDLREDFEWAGEISFASRLDGPKKYYDYEVSSLATIEIRAPLAYTDSKKVEVGTNVEFSISIKPEVSDGEFVGAISKYKEGFVKSPYNRAIAK